MPPEYRTVKTGITVRKGKRFTKTVWQIPDALNKVSATKLIVVDKNVRHTKNVSPGRPKGCLNYPPEFKQRLIEASFNAWSFKFQTGPGQ